MPVAYPENPFDRPVTVTVPGTGTRWLKRILGGGPMIHIRGYDVHPLQIMNLERVSSVTGERTPNITLARDPVLVRRTKEQENRAILEDSGAWRRWLEWIDDGIIDHVVRIDCAPTERAAEVAALADATGLAFTPADVDWTPFAQRVDPDRDEYRAGRVSSEFDRIISACRADPHIKAVADRLGYAL